MNNHLGRLDTLTSLGFFAYVLASLTGHGLADKHADLALMLAIFCTALARMLVPIREEGDEDE